MRYLSEIPSIIRLAWPLLIAQMTQTMMNVVDTIMAGRVSATDMAAVAIASSIALPILFFLQGIMLALPPIISRHNGAKTFADIPPVGRQALWLALLLSLPVLVARWFIPDIFAQVTMEPELKQITSDYLRYLLISTPAFLLYQALRAYCEGLGITKPSMIIMGIGLAVNIPANYIFIYGKLGVPAYGGAGCGIATALVFCSMAVATWLYTYKAQKLKFAFLYDRFEWPDKQQLSEIIRLGVPIALSLLFEVTLFAAIAILLAPFGATVVAAHQITLNFTGLIFMIPLSMSLATTIRIGELLGQNQKQQARYATSSAQAMGIAMATFTSIVILLAYKIIPTVYTTEQPVIELASQLLLLAAISQFSDAFQVISGCALRGYKDAKAMFYITLFSYWGVGLTTGAILGLTDWIVPAMQAKGFWMGVIVGLTCAAILLTWRLHIVQKRHDQDDSLAVPSTANA